jgi:hypothetical protein
VLAPTAGITLVLPDAPAARGIVVGESSAVRRRVTSSSGVTPVHSPAAHPVLAPGYVIDHVQALKHGGSDTPANMQWQTKEAAKLKDRVE